MNEVKIINKSNLLGKEIDVWGSVEHPLFRASDVAVWIQHSDVSTMVKIVDEDEKVFVTNPNNVCGGQGAWFLTEDGLYEILMRSRKPIAKQFKKGVKKILHEIRTKGGYIATNENDSDEDIMARAYVIAQRTLARREERIRQLECENSQSKQVIEVQSERIAKDAPKVEYYDQTLAAENMLTTRQIANELGITPNELHNKLQQLKIIFRQSNQWLMNKPYSTWKLHGTRTYTYYDRHKDVTYSKPYLVWNQRGRRFILALYKNNFNVKLAISDINGKTAK